MSLLTVSCHHRSLTTAWPSLSARRSAWQRNGLGLIQPDPTRSILSLYNSEIHSIYITKSSISGFILSLYIPYTFHITSPESRSDYSSNYGISLGSSRRSPTIMQTMEQRYSYILQFLGTGVLAKLVDKQVGLKR